VVESVGSKLGYFCEYFQDCMNYCAPPEDKWDYSTTRHKAVISRPITTRIR